MVDYVLKALDCWVSRRLRRREQRRRVGYVAGRRHARSLLRDVGLTLSGFDASAYRLVLDEGTDPFDAGWIAGHEAELRRRKDVQLRWVVGGGTWWDVWALSGYDGGDRPHAYNAFGHPTAKLDTATTCTVCGLGEKSAFHDLG